MSRNQLLVVGTAMAAAVLAAGCAAGTSSETVDGPPTATPTTAATREPMVMSRTEALQVALAAVPPIVDGWGGATTEQRRRTPVCGDGPALTGVDQSVIQSSAWVEAEPAAPAPQDVQALRAVVAPLVDGTRDEVVRSISTLADCESSPDRELTTGRATVDGVEVVTVEELVTDGGEPVHYAFVAQVVDGLAVICLAEGAQQGAAVAAADDCASRAREAVDVIRGELPARGSVASAAVLAGRLGATSGVASVSNPAPVVIPCFGEDVAPPTIGVVASMHEPRDSGGTPPMALVQPFDDGAAASKELGRYRTLARRCTGEADLPGGFSVTRPSAEDTTTGDGGVRFESFFGTAKERQGTSQVTEVFAVGAHLVFVTGEGTDLPEAREYADSAIADILAGG